MMRFAVPLLLVASCAFAQPPGGGQRGPGGPPNILNSPEVLNYPLTMDKVEKWGTSNKAIFAFVKTHPDIQQKTKQDFSQAKSLDELVALAKSHANEYVQVIESSGISLKEYFLITGSLMSAYIAVQMQEHAPEHAPPANAANIAFVKANRAKLEAMFAEYQQMGRPAPAPSH